MSPHPHACLHARTAASAARPAARPQRHHLRKAGFTLAELGVVIAIIIVLVGILLPVVHKVRLKGYGADTANEISEISAAIERYDLDQHAYPGPLANDQICDPIFPNMDNNTGVWTGNLTTIAQSTNAAPPNYDGTSGTTWNYQITMSENLVLGLLGGLWVDPTITTTGAYPLHYDPTQVGQGPQSLANNGSAHRFPPYIETHNLDWSTNSQGKTGRFIDGTGLSADGQGGCFDSPIPEFVDRYPSPLPILYLRAKPGPSAYPGGTQQMSVQYNPVITDDPSEMGTAPNGGPRCGVYDINQIAGYTRAFGLGGAPTIIGAEKESITPYKAGVPTSWPNGTPAQGLNTVTVSQSSSAVLSPQTSTNYYYPFDAFPYFANPSTLNVPNSVTNNAVQARNQDGFILISAGEDRTYGTADDITSFGSVLAQ